MKLFFVGIFLLFLAYLANKSHPETTQVKSLTLVKLQDTIYHCEEVVQTPCGYYLACGGTSFHCAKNIVTEKIH